MTHYIILTGKRASGKDTFADHVKEKYEIPSIRFSDVIASLGIELGLITKEDLEVRKKLQFVGNTLRSKYGEEFYTKKLANQIINKSYILNGMRHQHELGTLRKILGSDLILVGITASLELRYKRALEAGRVSSYDEFLELEKNPAETKIASLLLEVDVKIENDGELSVFHKKIDEWIETINLSPKKIYN